VVAPDDPNMILNLGAVLGKRGEDQQAIELYNRSLGLGQDYAELHYNIAGAFVRTRDFERAAFHYRRALAAPRRHIYSRFGYSHVHFNLGGALATMGRHAEAAPHFEQAIRRGLGGAVAARIAWADALWLSGDAAAAWREYEAALRIDPQSARARRGLDRARPEAARRRPGSAERPGPGKEVSDMPRAVVE
jgi:tetratricopeptide (TPR) repeat protein